MRKFLYLLILLTTLGVFPNSLFGQPPGDDGGSPDNIFFFEDDFNRDSGTVTGEGYEDWHNDDLIFGGYSFADASHYAIDMAHAEAWFSFQIQQILAGLQDKRLIPTTVQLTKYQVLPGNQNEKYIETEYTITYIVIDINVEGPHLPPKYLPPK